MISLVLGTEGNSVFTRRHRHRNNKCCLHSSFLSFGKVSQASLSLPLSPLTNLVPCTAAQFLLYIGNRTKTVVLSQQQAAISTHDLCFCHNGSKLVGQWRSCWAKLWWDPPRLPPPTSMHIFFSDKSAQETRLFCPLTTAGGKKGRTWLGGGGLELDDLIM